MIFWQSFFTWTWRRVVTTETTTWRHGEMKCCRKFWPLCKRAMYMFFVFPTNPMANFNVSHLEGLMLTNRMILGKKNKSHCGKNCPKIDLEKHDLLHFPFFLEQSGRREPMWMESKIKSFGWFCKRHLFKFCIFSTSEGGCLCFGAKYTAACQVLEDVKTRIAFAHWVSNKVQIENHFLSLKVWNCVWQAAVI